MIDWDRIAELQEEVGEDSFIEVIGMFFEEVEEVLARLDCKDAEQLKAGLHFLKGAALNIGMSEVSNLCREAESVTAADNASAADIEGIRIAYESSKAELGQIFD